MFCGSSMEVIKGSSMEVINFKKEKIKFLTKVQHKPYEDPKICYMCKEKFEDKHSIDKKISQS